MRNVGLTLRLIALILLAIRTPAVAETVRFPAGGVTLTGELFKPAGAGPFPAVVALHGCSGLFDRRGLALSARHRDWAERLVDAGYVVLFADSFTARGLHEICTLKHRPIDPEARAVDAIAALNWLARQRDVDSDRINLLGWSHGAMTTLWTTARDDAAATDAPRFASAIAFYPGCIAVARLPNWRPKVPLTILSGAADDWTKAEPCRRLAEKSGVRFIAYPGAYHDFDAPDVRVHVRHGLSAVIGGRAHIGTDPAARAASIVVVMDTFAQARAKPH
jgi:dienelactone hydrolase